MRKTIIAGNWKMNNNHEQAGALVQELIEKVNDVEDVEIVVCPPFTSLSAVHDLVDNTNIGLGAQNMHWEEKGAFTGEVSANMLLTLGCRYVILGHSERRTYFHETDEIVARKTQAAIKAGLTPIVCVGETLEERESGVTESVIKKQVEGSLQSLSADEFNGTVLAYEPVWAIGTGLTATSDQAQEVHSFIRGLIINIFGDDIATVTRIQYGGSMKPGNAGELLSMKDIDGGLIGGAALDAGSFEGIIRAGI